MTPYDGDIARHARLGAEPAPSSRGRSRVAFAEAWYRNLERYVSKHYRLPGRVLLKTMVAAGALLRAAAGAVRRDRLEVEAHARVLRGSLTGWRGYDRRVH